MEVLIIIIDSTITNTLKDQSKSITTIAVSIAILLALSVALIITVVVLTWGYRRKIAKQKLYTDTYSTLRSETGQQIQSQHLQHNSAELYDQIHLSPFTGQTEYIPKDENANTNNQSATRQQNSQPTHLTAGEGIAEHSSTLSAINQATTSQKLPQNAYESTWSSEQPTYAAIDTSKKKFKKQKKKEDPKHEVGEKGPPVNPYVWHEVSSVSVQDNATKQEIDTFRTIEEMYTAVKKKPKGCEPKGEEETPPIPPHTVEELYTAVQKKPKSRSNADVDNNDHNIPSYTVGEMQVARKEILKNTTKDLHTAVMDKSNDGSTDDIETAPPIPPHTVEELYTAVMKTPKGNAEDEKEAPPIPPYTMEEN